MIFAPEYAGVCSCRTGPPPTAYKTYAESGDQLTAPMRLSCAASFDSRPSAIVRIHSSVPRADAMRAPSGEATPSAAPFPRPTFPPRPRPVPGAASDSALGGCPSRSDTYRVATPARSHVNVTCRPSADQPALDGWRMSMRLSIVSAPPASAGGDGTAELSPAVRVTMATRVTGRLMNASSE